MDLQPFYYLLRFITLISYNITLHNSSLIFSSSQSSNYLYIFYHC